MTLALFNSFRRGIPLTLPSEPAAALTLVHVERWLDTKAADALYRVLLEQHWNQEEIDTPGGRVPLPRLTLWWDHIGFHADKEKDLEYGSPIASVSLGAPRRFLLRPRRSAGPEPTRSPGDPQIEVRLEHGDLLIMPPGCQQRWVHSVPKQAGAEPRISLTWRRVVGQFGRDAMIPPSTGLLLGRWLANGARPDGRLSL